MSTYDDFDGVYFTIQSIRLHHPEIAEEMSFLVIDNHPEGPYAADLKELETRIPRLRYLPFRGFRGTAVRDLLFRAADADVVLCVDSHVLFAPGALRALLDHFDADPESSDLVQGPLLADDLQTIIGSHFAPRWESGMYGAWAADPRALDRDGDAFDIPMQGLGAFACRRDAWPGFNPRFRGFGGEEGYIHEKFRQRGGRVLCLPAFRWTHRFPRPLGPPYRPEFVDRIRNYRIGWTEIGWDLESMESHFRDHIGDRGESLLAEAARQVDSPFTHFDGIFCLNDDHGRARWDAALARFERLDLAWRVERFPAVVAPGDEQRATALSWRAMLVEARARGYEHVVLFDDEATAEEMPASSLAATVAQLARREWDLFFPCDRGVAVHRRAFDRLVSALPSGDTTAVNRWMQRHASVDHVLAHEIRTGALAAVTLPGRQGSY